MIRILIGILITTALAAEFAFARPGFASSWTDRSEYDLALKIHAEASPERQIALLDEWKSKYPSSAMKGARLELYLAAYRAQGDVAHSMSIANEMLASDPKSVVACYWSAVLVPSFKDADSAALEAAGTAANQILSDPAYAFVAHRALGWIAWRQNKLPDAETELTAAAQLDPQNAEIAEWLGTVLVQQNAPAKAAAAVWQLARASSLKGEKALPEVERGQVLTAVERVYKRENGDLAGLDQIKVDAAASPFPPDKFAIGPLASASSTDSAVNAAVWPLLKNRLAAPDAAAYFDGVLKGKAVPPFKARVVRCTPAGKPKEVALSLSDANAEDVLLTMNTPLPNGAKPGTEIEFTGQAAAFTPEPFLLTVAADPGDVTGWPGSSTRRAAKH